MSIRIELNEDLAVSNGYPDIDTIVIERNDGEPTYVTVSRDEDGTVHVNIEDCLNDIQACFILGSPKYMIIDPEGNREDHDEESGD